MFHVRLRLKRKIPGIYVESFCRVSSQRYQLDHDYYHRHARVLRISEPMPLKSGLSLVTEGGRRIRVSTATRFDVCFLYSPLSSSFSLKFSATVLESSGRCSSLCVPFILTSRRQRVP